MPLKNEEAILSKFNIKNRTENRMVAYCPAHDDRNASMSILLSDKKILLYCHAGCKVEDIVKAAGLEMSDLFLDMKAPTNIYQYRDANGELHHEKLRYKTPQGKRFTQRRIEGDQIVDNLGDIPRIPYNYPEVKKAIQNNSIIVYTEGEKDADTAGLLGFVGTTMGGASDWKEQYTNYFRNAVIVLIPDKDDPGLKNANKVSKALIEVCKSLKIVVLPTGKDLTEWVEAGNSNLKDLINNAPEQVTIKGYPDPKMTVQPNGFHFDWNGLNLKIVIDRLKGEDDAEISVYESDYPIYISGIRLLSVSHKSGIAKALNTQRKLDWERILNQVVTRSLAEIRRGEEVVMLDSNYGRQKPEYLLYPLFVKNAVNTIYADRSSAKSLFITLVDIILSLPHYENELGLDIKQMDRHTVLFADWENDPYITGWTKETLMRGLGLEWCELPYLRCNRPLVDMIDHLRDKITETRADILIIDSLGMAVSDDLNASKPALNFHSALRQLPVTPIILAHTSKDINNRRKTIYGNAYYENEARTIWELVKEQEPGMAELTLSLFQRKAPPFAGYSEPMAYRFLFDHDKTHVETAVPLIDRRTSDSASSEDKMSDGDLAISILYNSGKDMKPGEISEASNGAIKPTSIGKVMTRLYKQKLVGKKEGGFYYYVDPQ